MDIIFIFPLSFVKNYKRSREYKSNERIGSFKLFRRLNFAICILFSGGNINFDRELYLNNISRLQIRISIGKSKIKTSMLILLLFCLEFDIKLLIYKECGLEWWTKHFHLITNLIRRNIRIKIADRFNRFEYSI